MEGLYVLNMEGLYVLNIEGLSSDFCKGTEDSVETEFIGHGAIPRHEMKCNWTELGAVCS